MTNMQDRLMALSPEKRKILETLLTERAAKSSGSAPYRAPVSRAEKQLAAIWEAVLGRGPVGLDDNFFSLGGDSIHCIQVVARAREAGLHLTNKLVFAHPTISALSPHLDASSTMAAAKESRVAGPFALTPIQRWFFNLELAEPQHWNQAVFLDLLQPVRAQDLQEALTAVVLHHDALQLRFVRQVNGWVQHAEEANARYLFREVYAASDEEIACEIAAAQTAFDLEHGPLLAALLFHPSSPEKGDARSIRLLLTAHHLLVDAVSFRILLEDLESAILQLQRSLPVELSARTGSYAAWSDAWLAITPSKNLDEQAHWTAQLATPAKVPLENSTDRDSNTEHSAASVIVSLSEEETAQLQRSAASRPLLESILEGVGGAFTAWAGKPAIRIDVEGHGRDALPCGPDVSRTVGWFTSIYPVSLSATGRIGSERQVPHGGSRFLHWQTERTRQADEHGDAYSSASADVLLNYLGSFAGSEASTLFRLAGYSRDLSVFGPRNVRPHLLQIVAGIWNGQLRFEWRYSRALHHPSTIEALAAQCLRSLRMASGAPTTAVFGSVTKDDLNVLAGALGGESCT